MAAPDDNVLSESMEEAHERVFAGGTSLTDLIQGLVDLMDDEVCWLILYIFTSLLYRCF